MDDVEDRRLELMARNDAQRDFRAYMRELRAKERKRIPPVTLSPAYDCSIGNRDCAEDDYSEESFP